MTMKMATGDIPAKLKGEFLEEYSTEQSVRKYTKGSAGNGISYLLEHDYGRIYLDVLEKYVPKTRMQQGIRLLEFGCGAGMNLLHLVSVLERRGIRVESAYGTDFSETLIEAANREAKKYLTSELAAKVRFCVAKNESLVGDLAKTLGSNREALRGSFDLIFGVNTIRYCHRLMNENACVGDISDLLTDHGLCVVIDMNDKFPAFRSSIPDRINKDKEAYYLPSLEEYARPFSDAGFEILRKENFCWIPHSAGRGLTAVMRALTPVLNTLVPSRAMRSLVISRKNEKERRSVPVFLGQTGDRTRNNV